MSRERTILVVDDAALFRELGALFLARSGRVITAGGGEDGLFAARDERPDVIVADLNMPDMSGEALCRAIKSDPELGATPVILVATGDDSAERARAIRAGADDVLAKPINRISLIQAVNRFVRFPDVKGLARVSLDAPVRVRHSRSDAWGTGRNLSRGGIFIETVRLAPCDTEVELQFQLPGAAERTEVLSPTARVVWHREPTPAAPSGIGLQFLALDNTSASRIDAFVYERAAARPDPESPGSLLTVR